MNSEFRRVSIVKDGWRYTTELQMELPYDAYHLTKTGGQAGPQAVSYDDSSWNCVSIPHDYAVIQQLSPLNNNYNGFLERKNAWYRRIFKLDVSDMDKQIVLRFMGVSGESKVWINGCFMHTNYSSFCGFDIDITDVVRFGAAPNVIALYMENSRVEGWWYQGCGIFRDVCLIKTARVSVKEYGLKVATQKKTDDLWLAYGEISVGNTGTDDAAVTVKTQIVDAKGIVVGKEEGELKITAKSAGVQEFAIEVASPQLWGVEHGNLYTCRITIMLDGRAVDRFEQRFGFRFFEFTVDKGFFLNGEHVDIKGMCYHEDEGNLGWAIGREVYERRIRNLIEMGGNAYRCSHNPPAIELLEICDRYGILVMDELRRFDSGQIAMDELEYMVCRDRNHPSIIIWSMGNEEPWQGDYRGRRIVETMRGRVRALDNTRPVTMAMHNGILKEGAGCASDIVGINYNHTIYDEIRKKYPNTPIICTEVFNIADYIIESGCNYSGSEGAFETLEAIRDRPYISGSFAWAGQEYRGEHRNLAFFTDCCPVNCNGDRKDGFYRYKAMWTSKPLVHICGHWNHKAGDMVKIEVFANTDTVELIVNDEHIGETKVSTRYNACFKVKFKEGLLKVIGKNNGMPVTENALVTAGEPVRLRLEPEFATACADGCQMVSVDVTAVDEFGNVSPTGGHYFGAEVNELAEIICCDNADPYCSGFTNKNEMVLYKGRGKVVLRCGQKAGELKVNVSSPMLEGNSCSIMLTEAETSFVEVIENPYINDWFVSHAWKDEPDIYQYTEDSDYITWQKYLEPATIDVKDMPFYFRTGFVIYCMEPNLPKLSKDKTAALVFEEIAGDAKILVSMRTYNNKVVKQFYAEKTKSDRDSVRMELPGVNTGDRLIIKLVVHCTEPGSGITGPVRFEL